MKINLIPTIIALAISALIGYALYALCKTEGQEVFMAILGGISLFLPLPRALGCDSLRIALRLMRLFSAEPSRQ